MRIYHILYVKSFDPFMSSGVNIEALNDIDAIRIFKEKYKDENGKDFKRMAVFDKLLFNL